MKLPPVPIWLIYVFFCSWHANAAETFELSLGNRITTDLRVVKDVFGVADNSQYQIGKLPELSTRFTIYDGVIVPHESGIMKTSHPYFDWVLAEGKIQQRDDGRSSMFIPLALIEKNANCIHNGVLRAEVLDSQASVDIVFKSETCVYFQFDQEIHFRGTWKTVEDRAAVKPQAPNRLPVRGIGDLVGVTASNLGQLGLVEPSDISAHGMVFKGIHYRAGCFDRSGEEQDCDGVLLPSYSLAKSLVAGLGLMRLEKMYPGAKDALLADYVPACSGQRWRGVTFSHLLDMATGNYHNGDFMADENAEDFVPFFLEETSANKIAFSCSYFPRTEQPGKRFVYHTSDSFLLGVAMNAFLAEKTAIGADYYRDLLVPIWKELGLSSVMMDIRRTQGEAHPFSGYGLVLRDVDIAQLAYMLGTQDEKLWNYFDREMLKAALQLDASDRGLLSPDPTIRYNNGFWAWNAKSTLGCAADTWLPFLSGFGGISVVIMPKGTVYYFFSDSGVQAFSGPVMEVDRMQSICGVIE